MIKFKLENDIQANHAHASKCNLKPFYLSMGEHRLNKTRPKRACRQASQCYRNGGNSCCGKKQYPMSRHQESCTEHFQYFFGSKTKTHLTDIQQKPQCSRCHECAKKNDLYCGYGNENT